ncbi:ATP synthase subunit I [Methylophaga thiooxydans]|uniref:ATP synthase subunit I n=1 Tax=Methylophaga thiooxydans TaxID=392484 RepID=UPI0023562AAB|nr:ATP synthase subunit I [Methylophaga thiooxydans]
MEQLARLQPLKRIVKWQVITLVLMTILFAWWQGVEVALAAGFGAFIALSNTLLMIWHIRRAAETARADAGKNLSRAYRCVAERWLSTIVMFGTGIVLLALNITALIAGFIAAQLMLFMGHTNRA